MCDIDSVERVERGICYGLKIRGKVSDADATAISNLLFDRMTETVFADPNEARALFDAHEASPVVRIPLRLSVAMR